MGRRFRLAQDFSGDALADLALGFAVHQKGEVGMAVQVDETGTNVSPLASITRRAVAFGKRPTAAILPSLQPLNPQTRASAAIEDVAVDDEEVVPGSSARYRKPSKPADAIRMQRANALAIRLRFKSLVREFVIPTSLRPSRQVPTQRPQRFRRGYLCSSP